MRNPLKFRKVTRLSDLDVEEVSTVDHPALGEEFIVIKKVDPPAEASMKFRKAREAANLTVASVAKRAELDEARVQAFDDGSAEPTEAELAALSGVLDIAGEKPNADAAPAAEPPAEPAADAGVADALAALEAVSKGFGLVREALVGQDVGGACAQVDRIAKSLYALAPRADVAEAVMKVQLAAGQVTKSDEVPALMEKLGGVMALVNKKADAAPVTKRDASSADAKKDDDEIAVLKRDLEALKAKAEAQATQIEAYRLAAPAVTIGGDGGGGEKIEKREDVVKFLPSMLAPVLKSRFNAKFEG